STPFCSLHSAGDPRAPHSFPTRRSSDLGTMPGQVDRYNMKRMISLTANIETEDLGNVAKQIEQALQTVNQSLWVAYQGPNGEQRSEEHTSELQSLRHLVCRLLLEKKKHK